MNSVDLLWLIKEFGNKLEKVTVFGRVNRAIATPSNFKKGVTFESDGMFAEMELIAVDLSYYESYLKSKGISNKVFLVNGSLAVYVPTRGRVYPDFYKTTGNIRFDSGYVHIFNWRKGTNNWLITQNQLSDIEISEYTNATRFVEACRVSRANGCVTLPKDVQKLPRFYAEVTNFVEATKTAPLNQQLTQAMNGVEIKYATDVRSSELIERNRSKIADKSPLYDDLLKLTLDSFKLRQDFVSNLTNKYEIKYSGARKLPSIHVKSTFRALLSNLKTRPKGFGTSGRLLIRNYLSEFKGSDKSYLGTKIADAIVSSFDEVVDFVINGRPMSFEGEILNIARQAFGDAEQAFAAIASNIIGVDLRETQKICASVNISFSDLLFDNPYALQAIGGFSFSDVEMIAMCLGKTASRGTDDMRSVAILNSYITGTENSDTVFDVKTLRERNIGAKLTKRQYEMCISKGNYLSSSKEVDIQTYIAIGIPIKYNVTGYVETKFGFEQKIPTDTLDGVVNAYVSTGLGVKYENYITSSILLKKELAVYDFFYTLGSTPSGLTSEAIDECIEEYEKIIGFPLMPEQRQAVHLLEWMSGVVSGCAGSGKTTTSNCFVYVKGRLDPTSEFKFATPTGKAAKRMQEVIKRPVKTMCSMFKTWQSTDRLFDKTDRTSEVGTKDTFFFDECAMVTIDLLYACIIKISDSSVYLFGDFHQLPPIGKGLPFKNLLRFMPCVFLTVSKRAAEGSEITLNSDYINNNSTSSNWKELQSGKDFMLTPCNKDMIKNVVSGVVKHYLGKSSEDEDRELLKYMGADSFPIIPNLTADDIQVATPVSKATYTWGCSQLNTLLQPIFNPTRGLNNTFAYQASKGSFVRKFIIGDRVLHSVGNMYSMQWYSSYKDGVFQKVYGFGAFNGDVGKVVAFMPADGCEFLPEDETTMPSDFEYPESLRDDSSYTGDDCWFVVVQYYDSMSDSNYYILYRCKELYDTDVTFGKAFYGEDFARLDLFYAGTVHKLQGSQYSLVICPLGDDLYAPTFLTRNLFYTAYTRAINLAIPIGSVSNSRSSALSKARTCVADSNTLTIGELLEN